ncbi:HNH endonuclease [Streptomyces sp. NPDC047130]|uniref:HNH endonuclease n=1 Tax=Streptomyces sp. NPDC047130 TaxID=3155261 RepID=UPI0033EFD84E
MTTTTRYTRARLAEAAARCTTMDDVIALLAPRPYPNLGRYLQKRFAHFGIDVSHFTDRRDAMRTAPAGLAAAVAGATSRAELLRRLGLPDTTTTRRRLRAWIEEAELSTVHFLGQAHQRGRPGTTPTLRAEEILVAHQRGYRTKTYLLRRALADIGVPERCARCGTGPEWQGKPMTLEVDHANGDRRDDRRENLRLLCPNCHAQTATWCRGRVRQRS